MKNHHNLNTLRFLILFFLAMLSNVDIYAQHVPSVISVESQDSRAILTIDRDFLQLSYYHEIMSDSVYTPVSDNARLSFEFDDSSGNFIPPDNIQTVIKHLKIPLNQILRFDAYNTHLKITYKELPEFYLEDVRASDGQRVIDTFSVEQLEMITRYFETNQVKTNH